MGFRTDKTFANLKPGDVVAVFDRGDTRHDAERFVSQCKSPNARSFKVRTHECVGFKCTTVRFCPW